MMMVCPKCGFSQPGDRFCAQCGVDVSHFQVKPKPWIVRFIQNPNLHLTLIGCLVVVVLGYIFYSQRGLLGKEVGGLFNDIPLLSRDSSDGNAKAAASAKPATKFASAQAGSQTEKLDMPSEQQKGEGFLPDEGASALPDSDPTKADGTGSGELEVSFWAVERGALNQIAPTADKSNDGGEGRVLVWQQSSKVVPIVEANGQQLEGGGSITLSTSPLTVTDGAEGSPLQFTSKITMSKLATGVGNEFNLKLEIGWHIPMPEVGRYVDASIDGIALLPYKGAVMVILDPAERNVRADLLKSVNGPMSIFASEEFKSGVTDWVLLVRQK